MHSLWFVQWDFTRRDHLGNLGRVFGSGPVNHPGKENVVADALSRKSRSIILGLMAYEWKMYDYISEFHPCFDGDEPKACFYTLVTQPTVLLRVIEAQRSDKKLEGTRSQVVVGDAPEGCSFMQMEESISSTDCLCRMMHS